MKEAVFAFTILSEVLLAGSLVLTLVVPSIQVWPPPGKNSWQYYFTWVLAIITLVGIITIGILDWNSFVIEQWWRFVIAVPMIIAGSAFALWGVRTLSLHTSLGLKGEFITTGPYHYSRNPQYVGDIVIMIGYVLLSNSLMTMITVMLGMIWYILAPFSEEPWLLERFGSRYKEYLEHAPRFIVPFRSRWPWAG